MIYRQWNLLAKREGNYIAVDYTDPNGKAYSEPFCFSTLDEAMSYGKLCIDRLINSTGLQHKPS